MESTFISIHDLSLDARLLYVSSSIEDILGYHPQEVTGRSCWEFFHPDEIPFARSIHGRSIQLDKAAVLNYCQIKNKGGRWVGCECVFTIVHDVLVASTSIYRGGASSQRRRIEAPVIRQLFSSSPRDPRYHMLSYISQKFSQETRTHVNEPRAALFLNRFSRTLAIMYATNGLAPLLGISADRLIGRSFYFCIQENCLREAVKCLESAKANDSIAYLRFWFRDPTQDQGLDPDDRMSDGHSTADEDDGGVHLSELMDHDGCQNGSASDSSYSMRSSAEPRSRSSGLADSNSRSPSGGSTDVEGNGHDPLFDQPAGVQSSTSSISTPDEVQPQTGARHQWQPEARQIELEAVVSCTSDGLVVVLRGARPFVPDVTQGLSESAKHPYTNGFFASPWANNPIIPDIHKRSQPLPDSIRPSRFPINPTAAQANTAAMHGPSTESFMNSIREVAVFAWSLIGINGSLVKYSRGTPIGESQPPNGLPIWHPPSDAEPQSRAAVQYHPPRYNYSPIDGAPIYDQMQLDAYPASGRVNGNSAFYPSHPATNASRFGSRIQNGLPDGQPTNFPRYPEPGSGLKDTVSINDFAFQAQRSEAQNAGAVDPHRSRTQTEANGRRAEHNTDVVEIKRESISTPQNIRSIRQHGDPRIGGYDSYTAHAYPGSGTAINGSAIHRDPRAPFDSSWHTSNAPQEQAVNGYSR